MKTAITSRNSELDSLAALLNNGYLRIYSGTEPATPETALSGNTLLAELRFNATAFGASASGVITANAITADTSNDATGTATFFRAFKSDGTTVVLQGTVGTSASDINLNSTAIQIAAQTSVSSFTVTDPQ
jgi:hypothetical protein